MAADLLAPLFHTQNPHFNQGTLTRTQGMT